MVGSFTSAKKKLFTPLHTKDCMNNDQDIVYRLQTRATIRRQIATRKSVQEGKPDRIADILEEAAREIAHLERELADTQAQRDKARNDALEEAAKVCDRLRNKNYSSEDERWVAGTDDCAAAIRAMKESAP